MDENIIRKNWLLSFFLMVFIEFLAEFFILTIGFNESSYKEVVYSLMLLPAIAFFIYDSVYHKRGTALLSFILWIIPIGSLSMLIANLVGGISMTGLLAWFGYACIDVYFWACCLLLKKSNLAYQANLLSEQRIEV